MMPEPHSALDRTQGRRSGSCAGAPAVVAVARRLRGEVAPARWLLRCRRAKRPGQSLRFCISNRSHVMRMR